MSSSLLKKLGELLRSPEGKKVVTQVRRKANQPETRAQLKNLLRRLPGTRSH